MPNLSSRIVTETEQAAPADVPVVVATFAPHPNSPAEYVRFAFAGPTGAEGAAVLAQAPARRSGDVGPVRLALGEAIGMGLPSK
jgi:iron complex transport system permease protein